VNCEIDIKRIRDKALNLIPAEKEYNFDRDFNNEIAFDLIENIEDYLAEGVASYYLNNYV